jgi:gamma-glutamyltranspeptidase/glutathione hydrolase
MSTLRQPEHGNETMSTRNRKMNRRIFLGSAASAIATQSITHCGTTTHGNFDRTKHLVIGQIEASETGNRVLDQGGNAVDAVVAAALVAGVVALPSTGIGGYGGSLVVGGGPNGKVSAIDFNTAAPAAMREDTFQADERGYVAGDVNKHGWQSVGVPGVLAGLQKALDLFGTRSFAECVHPAIRLASDGFVVSKGLAASFKTAEPRFRNDLGSTKLFLSQDKPLREGSMFRNPELAKMLESLAIAGNVAPFYQGEIAERIASQSRANGGLLTAQDFAEYQARVVEPISISWNGYSIHTPPATSGGITVLQVLSILRRLGWPHDVNSPDIAMIEAARIAWFDRLAFLGDPLFGNTTVDRFLSEQATSNAADRIRDAIQRGKPLTLASDGRAAGGTIHLNAMDRTGLTAAITFTHGDGFGAQVTADGIGLVLGHGLSRFDPRPGRPNSPGPSKRPLHNMCPTLVTQADRVVCALGATGGRRIVSAVGHVLSRMIGQGESLQEAAQQPRFHTEGELALTLEPKYANRQRLESFGYQITQNAVASLSGIERLPTGDVIGAKR